MLYCVHFLPNRHKCNKSDNKYWPNRKTVTTTTTVTTFVSGSHKVIKRCCKNMSVVVGEAKTEDPRI